MNACKAQMWQCRSIDTTMWQNAASIMLIKFDWFQPVYLEARLILG